MRLDRRLLGWGVFFVLLGAIPLLVRAGALERDLLDDWPTLWPLLPIGWGLSLLLRRTPVDWIGGAVSTITLGVMGGGLIVTGFGGIPAIGCGDGRDGTPFETRGGSLSDGGSLGIEFDCGTLTVVAADGSDWSVAGRDPDGGGPTIGTNGDRVAIRSDRDASVFKFREEASEWTVGVPRGPAIDLGLTLNAGQGDLDLAGANLRSANVTLNAGDLDIDLGAVAALGSINGTVNAGSATITLPAYDGGANLSLNAGSVDVCLATGTEFRVHWSGALGSHNFDGLGLVKLDAETWATSGYGSAATSIDLNVSANAGSFTLRIGGTCGG